MIKHSFRTAWRNLWKNKGFAVINIAGLAIGITCCLLMAVYIRHERSYDDFERKGDRIVRMIMEYSFGGSVSKGNYTSTKVAPSFQRNFPEVEGGARMAQYTRVVRYDDKLFNEKRFVYADSSFFDMFSFSLLEGSPKDALSGPNKVLLSQSTARKYFGNSDPLGKTLKVGNNGTDYIITGIVQDAPSNSQIKYDFIGSFSSLGANQEDTYWDANYTTYLLLKSTSDIPKLQSKIPGFMKKEMAKELSGNDYVTYWLEPMKTIHLHSEYGGFEPNSSSTYVNIVMAVAFLMLLIACFTYVNLSTARAMERAKEAGIRKVSGALNTQIFWQFIVESFCLAFVSFLLSLLLATLLLPAFNTLAGRELPFTSLFTPGFLLLFLLVILIVSFIAASYPALVFSRFRPIKVLKGAFKNSGTGLWVRKSLIVFQFVISVFLIISTFIIQRQLHFIQTKDLGFNRNHVLVLPLGATSPEQLSTVKTILKSNPAVLHVSHVVDEPTNIIGGYNMRRPDMPEASQIMTNANPVDEEFIATAGIHLIAGSDFSEQDVKDVADDKNDTKQYHYIINQTAAKALGWTPEEAIGKKIFLGNQRPGIIKGVIRDFNFSSLRNPVKPLVLFNEIWGGPLLVKISGNNVPSTLTFLNDKWKELFPNRPFEYHFMDEDFDNLYSEEMQLGKVLNIFSAIAILLACMGLLGLSAFIIRQRNKEISIRKVLGASVANIISLLSIDFVRLVILSMLIAFPLAGWLMHRWLTDFAYRIHITWWLFAIAAFIALALTVSTITIQALRTAVSKPVNSLRTE